MNEEQKKTLDKYYHLFQVLKRDRALPAGSLVGLQELAFVREELNGKKSNLYCFACISEMMYELYQHYKAE